MLFPTTLVGSYPQPEWLIDRKKLAGRFPPRVRARELWRVERAFLQEAQDDATVLAIRAQEEAGLDIITDGEIRRESYSNRFATALEGVDIDNPGSALDRSGHPNPVPRIVGKIRRKHPVEVQDLLFLKKTYRKAGEDDRARSLHHVAAGAERLLQVRGRSGDGLRRGGERRRSRTSSPPAPTSCRSTSPTCRRGRRRRGSTGLKALNRALEGVSGVTAVHICFGYAAIIHARPSGYSFLPEFAGCSCQQVSIETAQSNLDCAVLEEARRQEDHGRRASTSPT